jgi:peptide methionine sulfoxide reductase msrA/msrB
VLDGNSSNAFSKKESFPMSEKEIKKKLTPLQYNVTRENGTEKPFDNTYWDNKKPGLYVDVLSGEVLFSSVDKFASGTGWPSFTKPVYEKSIHEVKDNSHGMMRVEVRSTLADSHLGHVFTDGPEPTGLRYCINSAALRFISVDNLKKEGYGEYAYLFENPFPGSKIAMFAGGCFWCMEGPFEVLDGVFNVVSGYIGGNTKNPTYEEVCSGETGHYEAVKIWYDPEKVTYNTLLDVFWRQIDPTDNKGQFADKGSQYLTAIFYTDGEQKKSAIESKKILAASGRFSNDIVTQILPSDVFYTAEEYHQDYYKKRIQHYKSYRKGSGREDFLKNTWKD